MQRIKKAMQKGAWLNSICFFLTQLNWFLGQKATLLPIMAVEETSLRRVLWEILCNVGLLALWLPRKSKKKQNNLLPKTCVKAFFFCLSSQFYISVLFCFSFQEFSNVNVGSIFLESVDFFQAYEIYCSKQVRVLTFWERYIYRRL